MTKPLWLPFADRELIPQGSNDPFINPIGDIFHIAVSESSDLYNYFDGPSGGIESTGYIRYDGSVKQYRPFNVECDAQNMGNSFFVNGHRLGFNSWECQGMGDGKWTADQLDTIKKIIRFKHETWGIPLRQCPDWNRSGSGYHRLFYQWNKNGHSCPGDARVAQWKQLIIPWMEEDDVALTTDDINKIANAVWLEKIKNFGTDGDTQTAQNWLLRSYNVSRRAELATYKVRDLVSAGVKEAVAKIDANASPAEVKALLENLDATIKLVVQDGETA